MVSLLGTPSSAVLFRSHLLRFTVMVFSAAQCPFMKLMTSVHFGFVHAEALLSNINHSGGYTRRRWWFGVQHESNSSSSFTFSSLTLLALLSNSWSFCNTFCPPTFIHCLLLPLYFERLNFSGFQRHLTSAEQKRVAKEEIAYPTFCCRFC